MTAEQKDSLISAEENVVEDAPSYEDGVGGAREAEEGFSSTVVGKSEKKSKKKKKRFSRKGLKKSAPVFAIVIALIGFVLFMFGAQLTMPFAVVNRLIEEFNTNGVSSVLRSDNLLDLQLSMSDGTVGLSTYQISALEEQGITVGSYANTRTLTFKKSNGKYQTVVSTGVGNAGSAPADAVRSSLPAGATFDSPAVINVVEAFENAEFKNAYTAASKTWRGGNSGWYDTLEELAENIQGYSRSRWFYYTVDDIKDKTVFLRTASSELLKEADGALSHSNTESTTETTDSEGKTTTTTTSSSSEMKINTKTLPAARKAALVSQITSYASTGVNIGCAVVDALMGVQTLLTTVNRIQKINLTSGYMESVQKVMAGDGTTSPMNEYNNRLVEVDSETGKTAMNSAGMGALFTGSDPSPDDESVKRSNTEHIINDIAKDKNGDLANGASQAEGMTSDLMNTFKSVIGSANGLLTAFTACQYTKGVVAIVNLVATTVSTILSIVTFGITGFIHQIFKSAAKIILEAAIAIIVPIIATEIIKYAGNLLVQDVATDWLGEDLGNALVSGGNTLLSSNHQTGGGSPASGQKLTYFKRLQDAVIADEAEYQRQTRSPFDISSQYTFFGSLVYSLIPMANSANSLGSVIKSVGTILKNSVTDLLPTASAIAETNMVGMAKPGDCPVLENIGIQGDIYCNPLYITDTSTITVAGYANIFEDPAVSDGVIAANGIYQASGNTPSKVAAQELSWGNVTNNGDGTYTIVPGSELYKYIVYCGQRVSSWGIADANISSSISDGNWGSKLSAIPILGDVGQIATAAAELENLPWTTGSACVASDSNEYWNTANHHNQTHQRFIEDERWRENVGTIEESSVSVLLEKYYEENPLDNSFEGILARYSGMTKDDVIATLDLIDGLNYIANYHPEERLAFGKTEEKEIWFEHTESVNLSELALETRYIIYSDVRNRTKIV